MIGSTVSQGDTVARLFGERQKLEAWLSALEARRASTPSHIFERVRTDYQSRLRGVVDQLKEHRATVQSMVDSMEQRLAALAADEGRHQDDRAEAELRAAIGELDANQCRVVIGRADEALSNIAAERAAVTPELSRLREVLTVTADGPRATEPAAARRPEPPQPAMPAAAAPPPAAPPPSPPPVAAPAAAGQPAAPERAGGLGAFDDLEFLKSVVDSRSVGTPSAAPLPSEPAPLVTASAARQPGTPLSGAPRITGSVPIFLRDVPSEQTKTLKCQECGTLNYPTEWYCERCGAELAAL